MNNETYIFEGLQTIELPCAAIKQALKLCINKRISNIKLVVQDFTYEFDFVASCLSKITGEGKDEIMKKLNKRAYRIDDLEIGFNVMSIRQFSNYSIKGTVFIFLTAYKDSFLKVKNEILAKNDNVILCVPEGLYDADYKTALSDMKIISHKKI